MADIRLNVTGDGSGARSELSSVGEAVKKLDNALGVSTAAIAKGFAAAAAAIAAFAAVSLKAYMDSERTSRQLVRAAGDYAGAIDEQSKALSRLYAVDDDIINQSATLLAQWGGAAAASKQAEVAALNLAAAMGTDLNTATHDLIRNVESGGTGLAKMGIHFKVTGDKGKDFEAAVAAINAKLGGAAAADAGSLTGQLHSAGLAFEDIQKSIGGSVAAFLKQAGIVEKLVSGMRALNEMFTPSAAVAAESQDYVRAQIAIYEAGLEGRTVMYKDFETKELQSFEFLQEQLSIWTAKLKTSGIEKNLGDGLRVTGKTNKGMKDAAAGSKGKSQSELDDASLAAAKEYQSNLDSIDAHAEDRAAVEQTRMWALAAEEEKAREERGKNALEFDRKMAKEMDERNAATEKDAAKLEEQAFKDQNDRLEKKAKQAQAAGDAIGAAMVNALADQLAKLAEGGEFDAAMFISEILAAAVGVAGTVIGTAFGQPAVGAAIGNLAAMGIRAGGSAISKGNRSNGPRTMHDGGWVGAPRFHDGGMIGADEVPIIAQKGEFMMSRAMVRNAGGPSAVNSMASGRGGSGMSVTIHAIDAKSMADSFSSDAGRGMRQSIRSGRGDLPSLLGLGVR